MAIRHIKANKRYAPFREMVETILDGQVPDKHKSSRNDGIVKKAETFARKFQEYRRRGRLFDGVLLAGSLRVMSVAAGPSASGRFPNWLDLSDPDDRLLASSIEVMRQHLHAPVILVTRDTNLTSKCDFAGVPCVAPPEPASTGTVPVIMAQEPTAKRPQKPT